MNHLYIQMLGDFTFRHEDVIISDNQNRTKKVWLLLAYVLQKRGQIISRKELIQLLWGDSARSSNPENALKITFHRVRQLLDQLAPDAGHKLIIWKENGYTWNMDVAFTLDTVDFERLCNTSCDDINTQIETSLQALDLYKGHFLSNFTDDDWINELADHYRNLYFSKVLETAPLLLQENRLQDAISVLKKAISLRPHDEELSMSLMKAYVASNDQKSAIAVYETLNHRLLADHSAKPGEEIFNYYREIVQTLSNQSLDMNTVLVDLLNNNTTAGALKCDYDYFKVLCLSEARATARSGKSSHVILLSILGKNDKLLSKSSINQSMERLGEHIRLSLRRGDAYTKCSMNQYIILLREANYENSCMVSERIISAYNKNHPRSSAKISYSVDLLTPSKITN